MKTKLLVVAYFAAIFSVGMLIGCQANSKPEPITGSDNLRYFHDERTGLCFAAMNSQVEGYQSTSITNVPCSDAVNKIIHGE